MRIRSGPNRADRGGPPGTAAPVGTTGKLVRDRDRYLARHLGAGGTVVIPAGDDSGKAPSQFSVQPTSPAAQALQFAK